MDYLGQERMGSAEFFYFGVQHSLALQTRAVSLRKGRRIKPLKSGRLKGECRGRGTPRARQVEASDEVISAI